MATDDAGDVLVVEDDPDMLDAIRFLLSQEGYATRAASNGAQALMAVAERKPALVLLDMIMPVMDGWRCGRELRARYGRSVRIVVVTAAEHASARATEIDADGVLSKPFDVADLLRIVAQSAPAMEAPAAV